MAWRLQLFFLRSKLRVGQPFCPVAAKEKKKKGD
jgi:hypothetical protein